MSSPVTTSLGEIDVTEGGTGYAPELGFSTIDAAGLWCYVPDRTNHGDQTSRILRINVQTQAVEVWLDHGAGLPPFIVGLCFSSDFQRLYATQGQFGSHVYVIDAAKTVADLGDVGANIDALFWGTSDFIGWQANQKNLSRVEISGGVVTITPDFLTANAWTSGVAIDAAGNLFRCYQKSGPGTDGPIFHYVSGKFPATRFDAGYLHNTGTQSDGAAYSAKFAAESLIVAGDGQTIYFTQNYRLRSVFAGVVSQISDATAVRALAYSNTSGRLVTRSYSTLSIWS